MKWQRRPSRSSVYRSSQRIAVAAESAPTLPTATAAPPARDYSSPARIGGPEDPPGWERIYEGSFLEAALVTQLSGDFPGPVLAVVSVPFYSADRQRILVPRGARVSARPRPWRTRTKPGWP